MIHQQGCPAVFHYAYLPKDAATRLNENDGGFSVTLFDDCRLVFSHYAIDQHITEQKTYRMPLDLKMRLIELMDAHLPYLQKLPEFLRIPDNISPRYISRFGYQHVPYLYCEDLHRLVRLDFGNKEGHAGRYLFALFEDVADLFATCGVELSPYDYQVSTRLTLMDHQYDYTSSYPSQRIAF